MKIKVCGMNHLGNIAELCNLPIDYIGMIFYSKSLRYVGAMPSETIQQIKDLTNHSNIKRIGVFVNEDIQYILNTAKEYHLDYVQLHGNESPELCGKINANIPVIKAFSIAHADDFIKTEQYTNSCNYFLFDTKTESYGGSGIKFDWSILNQYTGTIPFLLSGGISENHIKEINSIGHSQFYGIDINSRFELEPGLKDIKLMTQFFKELKS